MKKIISTLFFASLCLLSLFAQKIDYKLTKSKISKVKEKEYKILYSSSTKAGELITVSVYQKATSGKKPSSKYELNYYDSNLNLITTKRLPHKKIRVIGLMATEDTINLFSILKNKQGGIDYTLLSSALSEELNFKERKLFAVEKKDLTTFMGGFDMATHLDCCDNENDSKKLIFSENGQYMAFIADFNGSKLEARRIYVLDKNLNTTIDYTFRSDIKDKDFSFQSFSLDNKGNVFLLGKISTKKKKEEPDYYYELHKINNDGATKLIIDTEHLFVESLTTLTKNNRLACVGLYSTDSDYVFEGVIRVDVDMEQLKVSNLGAAAFTNQFIKDYYGQKKPEKYFRDFFIKEVFMLADGDVVFHGEESYSSSFSSTSSTWSTLDILAIRLGLDGKLKWARTIDKQQKTSATGKYISYTSTMLNDQSIFFLNNESQVKKNKDGRIRFSIKKFKDLTLYAIIVNEDGNIDYEKLMTAGENALFWEAKNGLITNKYVGDEVVILGSDKSKKQLWRINLTK